MIDVDALRTTEQQAYEDEAVMARAKQDFLPEVVQVLDDLLLRVDPSSASIGVNGWIAEPIRIYGYIRLYFHDRVSIKDAAAVLTALDKMLPAEKWKSSDEPASLTRTFEAQLGAGNREIDIYIHWSVKDAPDSGCYRRLIRVDRQVSEKKTPVYEIVCKEDAPA